ncbi:mucin-19 isoform X2 [Solenopsis invicta]|nr:mucin-19 isoform X2 [Solenopsis invicta]
MHPPLQFVISIHDPEMMLRNSAMIRQEAIARIIAVMKEVDGVEMNVTAGSKERLYNFIKSLKDEMIRKSYDKRIFIALPSKSEDLAKQFNIKELVKYTDLFTLPTDYLTDEDGAFVTFHPSRLMGLFDMLNTDSLVDLISGLGAPKQKILMTLPASAYKFTLKNENENAPRSETTEKEPLPIDRKQLCEALNGGEWTVERDEDLTAPYAFQNKTWIAFEDKISAGIKGKYALLRDLAGLAVRNIENDVETECEESLTQEISRSFTEFKRKSRQAVLNALEDELHQMQFSYPNHAKTSNFRVARKVDAEGHIRAVRESTQTEFVCRRQGYFVHPRSCNRFYRCVKFNQAVEDYSVFEFDCPAGLSFDERTEVCVWPGSLPEGSPCPGSSEIAPVAPKRFECTQSGYYADPQNCRWFFACMDLGESELMAFEFRCPYGLVFDEKKMVCEWPWLVPACSQSGSGYTRTEYNYGGYSAGASTGGVGVNDYVTGGLSDYSVTAGRDYSNVDSSRTTSTHGIHGTGYFGSTAGNIGTYPGISTFGSDTVSGPAGIYNSSPGGSYYSKSTGDYESAVSSVPTYNRSPGIQGTKPIVVGEGSIGYSTPSSKIGGTAHEYTGHDGTGYSISTSGFDAGFANRGPLGGVTAGFSGSTGREYSQTTSGSHLTEQGATYSRRPISGYPLAAEDYTRSDSSTSTPITDTSYSRTPGSYVGSTKLPGSSIGVQIESTSPKYVGSTNVYAGSSKFKANNYSPSTGVYSATTGRQPSFGETIPSFGTASYPSVIGNVEITGSNNREYTGSTATVYEGSTGAEYSKATGGISTTGSGENEINLSTSSGIGSNVYGSTSSGRVPGTNFISSFPKTGLGISTTSGYVSGTPGPTGAFSTGYQQNNEGYTIPVHIPHQEPSIYPSTGTTRAGTIDTSGYNLGGYDVTKLARPYLNVSISGNEISTDYNVQNGFTGAIQTGGSIDGSITTGDSFSGTVFSHGNIPGSVSTPAINQGNVLTGEIQPGYVTTSSETPGYVISDGKKTVDIGSASPGTLIYGTPSPAISINGPSTAGILLKGDSTPNAIISGQTAPGVSIGGSIQSGSTIESSTHKSYESSTYYGAPARGSSSTSSEGLIPTAPHGYRTDEGRGTFIINAGYDTSKYTDIPDYRPTSAIVPDSIQLFSGGKVEGSEGNTLGFTSEGSTTPRYFSNKSAVFTPSGFTKTGPTRTGITTAILGGGGSYSISTSDRRPTYSPDNISEKAFEGNVAGYTKTSSIDGLSVTLTPPGYSLTAPPASRFTIQSDTSGYSYPEPNVQLGINGATFSSTPIAPIGNNVPVTTSKPFYSHLPTSTLKPIIYTTENPEIYKATLFESNKTPVSTVRPIIDRTGSSHIASVTTSNIGVGVPFRRTDSSDQTVHGFSVGYLPSKSTETGVIGSTTKYDEFTVTGRPELGVTYKKPSSTPDVRYGGPSSFQVPTTFRPSNVYYPGQGFSTTPSSLGTTPGGGSPTNLDISRDKIDKLITNYDRGTIKYTPAEYGTSSEFDSNKKFTSSLSSTKSSFSGKIGSGFVTTSGIRPSSFAYEVTTKSPEGKVIIKWSDLHPLLLGKLGAECTCKSDPFANIRGPGKKLIESSKGKVDLANYDSSEIYVDLGSSVEDYSTNNDNLPAQPFKISAPKTTSSLPSSSYLPALDSKTSSRTNEFRTGRRMGKKLEYQEVEEEENEKDEYYEDDPDQIINGATDCARPGLFRHPSLCNKFYACHWDQWKKKFTLHIFNCPIHLTFDSNAGACNWPSKGPACQGGNLLV